jgi:glucosamine 6-phosphate synthetase-like amidotransferase/phosphosugar isomerase protein
MCGLLAIISKKSIGFLEKDFKFFTEAIYVNAVRGQDSTGIFSISEKGNISLIKDNIKSSNFIETTDYKNFLKDNIYSSRILVAHNRAATKGNVTAENAHPFLYEDTVLVHNGTIQNHQSIANTATDSEALTQKIAKTDHKSLEEIHGAYALIYYKAKEKILSVIRNEDRPLYIISTPELDIIGSESGMLEWLVYRHYRIELKAKYFEPYLYYYWDLTNLKEGLFSGEKIKKPEKPSNVYTYESFFFKNKKHKEDNYKNDHIINKEKSIFRNDIYLLNVNNIDYKEDKIYFDCSSPDYKEVKFIGVIYYQTSNDYEKLKNITYLYGRVLYSLLSDTNTIYVYPVTNVLNLQSINNYNIIINKGTTCTRCHKEITIEDNGTFHLNPKTEHKSSETFLCSNCINQIPKLKAKYHV